MLVGIALVTVAAFAVGGALAVTGAVAPAVAAHVVFAVGIVPLILAAISHFVPVLTRTGTPSAAIQRLPLLVQLAGIALVLALQGSLPRVALHLAATVDLLLVGCLAAWVRGRARACLGKPHPGWRWYFVALVALATALVVVPLMGFWPQAHGALRLLHLHLNTLGLVGLAAFGTLPVLLPTALNQPEPGAAAWLSAQLRWIAAGGLLAAIAGASSATPLKMGAPLLAVPATVLLVVPGLRLLRQWQLRFGIRVLLADGAAASLVAAVVGWMVLAGSGLGHAFGIWAARPEIVAFVGGFLLPLVTGALSQLLPVWRYRGVATPERVAMRRRLAATGIWRAGLFLVAGILLVAGLNGLAAGLLACGLLLFAVALANAWRS